jgi:[ribosomal protein S5]-alanine N-acetyltransferase
MLHLQFDPFPTLRTERLILRNFVRADAQQLLYLKSAPEQISFLDKEPMKNMTEAEQHIDMLLEKTRKNENIVWAICLKEDPAVMIGNISYWRLVPEHYRAEIGYTLHHDHWRKGYMLEALSVVIPYGFDTMNLHSIEANTNPDNKASRVVLERCGFVQEGYFKENFFYDGRFLDSAIYSLVKK